MCLPAKAATCSCTWSPLLFQSVTGCSKTPTTALNCHCKQLSVIQWQHQSYANVVNNINMGTWFFQVVCYVCLLKVPVPCAGSVQVMNSFRLTPSVFFLWCVCINFEVKTCSFFGANCSTSLRFALIFPHLMTYTFELSLVRNQSCWWFLQALRS